MVNWLFPQDHKKKQINCHNYSSLTKPFFIVAEILKSLSENDGRQYF